MTYDGTGSVEGGTGWYWVSIGWYWLIRDDERTTNEKGKIELLSSAIRPWKAEMSNSHKQT